MAFFAMGPVAVDYLSEGDAVLGPWTISCGEEDDIIIVPSNPIDGKQ
jgi:hypothetical protein